MSQVLSLEGSCFTLGEGRLPHILCQSKPNNRTFQEGKCCFCSRAQVANAGAVIVSSLPGQQLEPMTCSGSECSLPLTTFATMIPYKNAVQLQVGVLQLPINL